MCAVRWSDRKHNENLYFLNKNTTRAKRPSFFFLAKRKERATTQSLSLYCRVRSPPGLINFGLCVCVCVVSVRSALCVFFRGRENSLGQTPVRSKRSSSPHPIPGSTVGKASKAGGGVTTKQSVLKQQQQQQRGKHEEGLCVLACAAAQGQGGPVWHPVAGGDCNGKKRGGMGGLADTVARLPYSLFQVAMSTCEIKFGVVSDPDQSTPKSYRSFFFFFFCSFFF